MINQDPVVSRFREYVCRQIVSASMLPIILNVLASDLNIATWIIHPHTHHRWLGLWSRIRQEWAQPREFLQRQSDSFERQLPDRWKLVIRMEFVLGTWWIAVHSTYMPVHARHSYCGNGVGSMNRVGKPDTFAMKLELNTLLLVLTLAFRSSGDCVISPWMTMSPRIQG